MDKKVLTIVKEDLVNNINLLKKEMEREIIAVIKGDGYGLGLLNMAKILDECEINFFAVSEYDEALKLRENGYTQNILLLTPQEDDEIIGKLIENDITLTVASLHNAKEYVRIGESKNKEVKAHIKIDTGFGRFGFLPEEKDIIIKALRLQGIDYYGIYSHFSCSFEKEYKITKVQFEKFNEVLSYLKSFDFDFKIKHIANSCAAIRFPETRLDAVRLGSAILGRLPFNCNLNLKRIAKLETSVLCVNELPIGHNVGYANTYKTNKITKTAVIPVGYKDGFMVDKKDDTFRFSDILRYILRSVRSYGKKNYVEINDKKVPLIGRVGMYNIVCDITGTDIKVGDKVILDINPLYIDSKIKREIR